MDDMSGDLRTRVEAWVARWDDATLESLPLIQRVPLRHARDDLQAALDADPDTPISEPSGGDAT